MPDTITPSAAPAPETSAPSAAPAPAAAPTTETAKPAGMSRFMADIEGISGESKSEPKAKAAPEATKPKADAPPAKPATTAKTTAPAKPEAPKVEGIDQVRSRLKEVQENEKAVRNELETLRKEREELKRKVITPEVEADIERNKTETAELRQQLEHARKELSEVAYERSAEFQKKYIEPFNAAKQLAIESAKSYPVMVDEDGNTRPATEQDFYKVATAPRSERAMIARRLFGDNGFSVLADVNELEKMRATANNEIREHNARLSEREKEQQAQFRDTEKRYAELSRESQELLAKEYPKYFADSEDPASTEAWKKGREFVDVSLKRMAEMPLDERAAVAAVMHARASWFPRGIHEIKQRDAKIAELEAELAKVRGGDPGNGGERTETAKTEELSGGTAKLLERFKEMEG